jgi:serine/threonine protein kinase
MTPRVKLKATLVKELGGDKLAETISPQSYQRNIAEERGVSDPGDRLPVEGDVVGNHYRLVRRLGEGMFGRVYVAERTDVPEHRVAMKVLNRAVYAGRNVERELVMLAAATHPNIVELKDHGMTEDYVWLTMPLYDGETLADRLTRGPLGLREAYEIFLPIARGVAALHARGLRHQDIKPENIYLADFAGQLHPVLLDLGVAVEANATFIAGTALYAAPEQLAALAGVGAEGKLTEKMDTYCLGSTLLYSLVGEEHFAGAKARTPFDIASAFETREATPLTDEAVLELEGPPRALLIESLSRWLRRDADERPSAAALAAQLDVLLEKEREERRAIQRGIARQKTALRVVVGAVVLLAGGAALYGYSKRTTLRLAAELERVKAQGAESFDQLETCNAAHQLSQQRARDCSSGRQEDAAAHGRTLAEVRDTSSRAQASLNEQLTTANGKVRTCEEDVETMQSKQEELEQTMTEKQKTWDEERKRIEEEREQADTARQSCEAGAEKVKTNYSTCQQELAVCRSSDIYTAPPSSPGVTPGGSGDDSPYAD